MVSVAVVFAFLLVVVLMTVAIYAARYKVVPPDSAFGRATDRARPLGALLSSARENLGRSGEDAIPGQ